MEKSKQRLQGFLTALSVVAVLFIAFLSAKNIIVGNIIRSNIHEALGINIKYRNLDVSLGAGHLRIEGLVVENPPGFEDREFISCPLVNIICDPFEIIAGRGYYIYLLDLNIERLNVVKNKEGKVNLKEILGLSEKRKSDVGQKRNFMIEIFKLSMKDIYYTEIEPSGKVVVKKYPVNINDLAYGKLDKFDKVVKVVMLKALSDTDVGNFIGMTAGPLASGLKDIVLVTSRSVHDFLKGVLGIFGIAKRQ